MESLVHLSHSYPQDVQTVVWTDQPHCVTDNRIMDSNPKNTTIFKNVKFLYEMQAREINHQLFLMSQYYNLYNNCFIDKNGWIIRIEILIVWKTKLACYEAQTPDTTLTRDKIEKMT
jgi:hypothetical protein